VLWLVVLALLPGVFIVFALLMPNNQWLGPVVSRFETSSNEVWLTIDDGPTSDTPAVLDLLDKQNVRATFFVKGMLVSREWVDAITSRGHTIGNHSHTHPSTTFWCLPPGALAREIDECAAMIPPTNLFRAPVGHKNFFLHRLLRERRLKLIAFSARAYDAFVRDPERIAHTVARQVRPGAIVVLHQGHPWCVRAMERTIEEVRARGYSFVVPELTADS
jgi:peptidoglycan/xylan/chitin deacetylase (PgdA/CDA1 family)